MSLDPQQIQFATNPPATPLLDKAAAAFGQGLDAMINGMIEKVGGALDAATSEVRGMGKSAIVDVGGKGLSGDIASAPALSPGKGENLQGKGQSLQLEKSMVPERVQEQVRAAGSSNSMKVTEVAAADIGTFAPAATPTMDAGKSQSISI